MNFRLITLMSFAAALVAGCGGGGDPIPTAKPSGTGTTVSATELLAPGSYRLTFAAISTSRLAAPISGIEVAVRLPAGLSVSTLNGGASGPIASASITSGSALRATSLAFGGYSASSRTAYLSMATSQENYRGGPFLSLLFTVSAGAAVTPNDIFALNGSYPKYKVVGLDTVTHDSVTMTETVKTTLKVER